MSALSKKLLIKPGTRTLLIGAPSDVRETFDPPEGAKVTNRGKGPFDVVIAFATFERDIADRFDRARAALAEEGVLWMAYPKKSAKTGSDLSRDRGWEGLTDAGWAPVSQVSVDTTWSALRFRHDPELIAERRERGFMTKSGR